MSEKCFIFDIDGTLAKTSKERLKHLKPMIGSKVKYNGAEFEFIEELKNVKDLAVIRNAYGHFLARKEQIKFEPDYDAFNASLALDVPNGNVARMANIINNAGYRIFVLSGRSSKYIGETRQWLHKWGIPFDKLMMREEGNKESDVTLKKRFLEDIRKNGYEVIGVFDDRDKVVEMWRAEGLTCFQVAKGEY